MLHSKHVVYSSYYDGLKFLAFSLGVAFIKMHSCAFPYDACRMRKAVTDNSDKRVL